MARRSRRQREASARFWSVLLQLCIAGGVVGAIAYYAYAVGQQLVAQDVDNLHEEIASLTTQANEQAGQSDELRQALAAARQEATDYRERFEAVAPKEVQVVLDHVRAKMKQGLSADRLAFVISQAQEPHGCTDPESRRFLAKTQNYSGPNTEVRFNERVTVTGHGESAHEGREQWFDPTQPVTVEFIPESGKSQSVSGVLPLSHALVFKDREYHFTAKAGSRGFIEIDAKWCSYGD
jgi:F0F1-type ATP synthase membrane subunit b/b'